MEAEPDLDDSTTLSEKARPVIGNPRSLISGLTLAGLLLVSLGVVGWLCERHAEQAGANTPVISTLRSVMGHPLLFSVAGTTKIDAASRDHQMRLHLQEVRERQGASAAQVQIMDNYGVPVLEAAGVHLVTVLREDLPEFWAAEMPPEAKKKITALVAQNWRDTLQAELTTAASMHTSSYFRLACIATLCLLLLTLLAQTAIGHLGQRYLKSPVWLAKALLWTGTGTVVMCLFPDLQWIGGALTHKLLWPLWLLALIVLAGVLLAALSERILVAYFRALSQAGGSIVGLRHELRLETAAHAANVVFKLALAFIGALVYLSVLGVNLTATLTSLGALGVVVGLLAQEWAKNAAAGISVLLDDRYGMGDYINSDGHPGKLKVEAFTIFTTRVRDSEGAVICLPNHHLLTAKNLSKLWSQVDFRIDVSYPTDLDHALGVLLDEAQAVCADMADSVLAPPALLGVEELGASGITLRLQVRTLPAANWGVRRELNRRIKNRFDKEGIEIPYPQLALTLRNPEAVTALVSEPGR